MGALLVGEGALARLAVSPICCALFPDFSALIDDALTVWRDAVVSA